MLKFTFPDTTVIAATTYKSSSTQLPDLVETAGKHVVAMNQTHGSNCTVLTEYTTATVLDTDAVITTLPNLTLSVKTADCLPILLWHPSGIIGALHAGRLGTKQKILKKTLRLLKTQFNIQEGLHLILGPAICHTCYEVNLHTKEKFDLVAHNHFQALEVFEPNQVSIQFSGRCTAHEAEFFHSYRRDGKGVPMNYTVICRTE